MVFGPWSCGVLGGRGVWATGAGEVETEHHVPSGPNLLQGYEGVVRRVEEFKRVLSVSFRLVGRG